MTDAELAGAESENWIAVYKVGLTQLVRDLTNAQVKNVTLTEDAAELRVLLKLLRRRNENGYR
jgi:hypothetical protein